MNDNYPMGVSDRTSEAPWNIPENKEEKFEVLISQTLSRPAKVVTTDYIPEDDGYGGVNFDTLMTDWDVAFRENDHYTALELIEEFAKHLKEEIKVVQKKDMSRPEKKKLEALKHLLKECEGWTSDELEIMEN